MKWLTRVEENDQIAEMLEDCYVYRDELDEPILYNGFAFKSLDDVMDYIDSLEDDDRKDDELVLIHTLGDLSSGLYKINFFKMGW